MSGEFYLGIVIGVVCLGIVIGGFVGAGVCIEMEVRKQVKAAMERERENN